MAGFCAAIVLTCGLTLFGLAPAAAETVHEVTLQNELHPAFLSVRPGGNAILTDQSTSPDARWAVDVIKDQGRSFARFRAVNGAGYLDVENGRLTVGPVRSNAWSAMWTVTSQSDGSYRLENRQNPNIFLNTQSGSVRATPIQAGWASANWQIRNVSGAVSSGQPVPSAQPAPPPNRNGASVAGMSAGAMPAANGEVEITVTNEAYPQLTVIHIDQQNRQTHFFDLSMGQLKKQPADPGGQLAFAVNGKWVGQAYPISSQPSQSVYFGPSGIAFNGQPAGGQPQTAASQAQPGQNGATASPSNGTVEVSVDNELYTNLSVIHLDQQNRQTRFFDLAKGASEMAQADPGGRLAFAANGKWVGSIYPIGNQPIQNIIFGPGGMTFNSRSGGDQLQTATSQAQPKQNGGTSSLPSGTVEVTVENGLYAKLSVINIDQQNRQTHFFDVAKGQMKMQPAVPGQRLAFAVNGKWVGQAYPIGNQRSQSVYFGPGGIIKFNGKPVGGQAQANQAAAPSSSSAGKSTASAAKVWVWVSNNIDTPILVSSVQPGQKKSQGLITVASRNRGAVQIAPGVQIKAWDARDGQFLGEPYTVTAAKTQTVVFPIAPRGSVQVRVANGENTSLTWLIGDSKAQGGFTTLTTIDPGKTKIEYLMPGTHLRFADPKTNKYSGGFYTVTSAALQTMRLPVPISQADIRSLANQVTAMVAKQFAQDRSAAQTCWKGTYGRGVGIIPTSCMGAYPDKNAGLCYPRCRAGFYGVGPVCWQGCPSSFTDTGVDCLKPPPVSRDAFPWKFGDGLNMNDAMKRCQRQSSLGKRYGCGFYNSHTMVYSNCPPSYKTAPVITSLCTPVCPSNMTDIGVSCQKSSYGRGVGHIPDCGGNTPVKDAGLCYKRCNAGYNGVGPVCWGSCPAGWTDCGAMCGRSRAACVTAIGNQVTSTGMAAAMITTDAVTAGAATGATAAAGVAESTAEQAGKVAAKVAAEEAAKATLKSQVRNLLAKGVKSAAFKLAFNTAFQAAIATNVALYSEIKSNNALKAQVKQEVQQDLASRVSDQELNTAVTAAINSAGAKTGIGDNFDYSMLDPTGVASAVMSFIQPMCTSVRQ